MKKPYGRKTKQKVGKILLEPHRETAMEMLRQIPDEQLVGHLFSHFYHKDELIKFRSIAAMGVLGSRVGQKNMEKARIILRRIMWNLNDESGGIGWGSPEAMGEILYHSPELALEFKSILFSYLDPDGNYIEHKALQRGVLWGIGTYLGSNPRDLNEKTKGLLFGYLHSSDPVKRGYAVRALMNARCFDCSLVPENIMTDNHYIDVFNNWNFTAIRISDMALSCENQEIFA
ncbi:DVU0298 family protein [Desulfobacula sp.]|uniref:DVU0298 family protein n=1 Tax=Desulfobacula sp. TaxID=2593537 RepID=UPI00261FD9C3|nr:DVU0298 family protein [Desulfobacula sp.]